MHLMTFNIILKLTWSDAIKGRAVACEHGTLDAIVNFKFGATRNLIFE